MVVERYTKMAYDCADDMVFGFAKKPVTYGFGLKIGAGYVIPEINYAPRPGTEKDPERLRKEYVDYITKDILDRAITVGFPNVQLETEWVSQMNQAKLSAPVVSGQQELCEKYHEEFGLNCGTRQTINVRRTTDLGPEWILSTVTPRNSSNVQISLVRTDATTYQSNPSEERNSQITLSPTETSLPSSSE